MRYSPDLVQGFSRANSVCSQPAPEFRAGKQAFATSQTGRQQTLTIRAAGLRMP